MSEFQRVCSLSDLADPGQQTHVVDDRIVVLIRVGNEVHCLDDVCTHDGGPLGEGHLDAVAGTIACPRHGAKFDVRTGDAVTMPATEATTRHDVKIEDGIVWVRLR